MYHKKPWDIGCRLFQRTKAYQHHADKYLHNFFWHERYRKGHLRALERKEKELAELGR